MLDYENATITIPNESYSDVIYNLAFVQCRLKKYKESISALEKFLTIDPEHKQAQNLKCYVEKRQKADIAKGAAVISGVVGVGGLIIGGIALLASSLRKKH